MAFLDRSFKQVLEQVCSPDFDVSVPAGETATFYSGRNGTNRHIATRIGYTIDKTSGGRWLTDQDLESRFTPDEIDRIWAEASRRFARTVRGKVVVIVRYADADRAFLRHELPELLANPAILEINGLAREQLVSVADGGATIEKAYELLWRQRAQLTDKFNPLAKDPKGRS